MNPLQFSISDTPQNVLKLRRIRPKIILFEEILKMVFDQKQILLLLLFLRLLYYLISLELYRFLYIINFRKASLLEPVIFKQPALISFVLCSLPHINIISSIISRVCLTQILHEMSRRLISRNRGSYISWLNLFDWLIISPIVIILRGLIN